MSLVNGRLAIDDAAAVAAPTAASLHIALVCCMLDREEEQKLF